MGLAAVWRAGAGAQWVRWGMSVEELEAEDKVRFDEGLRISALAVRDGRFAAVWRPGDSVQWWRAGMTADEFVQQDLAWFAQGLRVTALRVDGGRYTAVWRPGEGTQWCTVDMAADEFARRDGGHFGAGLRVTSLAVRDGRFSAVWRPGTGTQWIHWNLTSNELVRRDTAYLGQGLRLTCLAADGDRYAAVWRPGTGEQWVSWRRGDVDFRTEDGARFARGLRIDAIELDDRTRGAYHYPWTSGESHTCTQGNNTTGSHQGVQSFAFDFGLPAGTVVRAARAGTVEHVRTDMTTAFDPNEAPGPDNPPITPGSPDNWGNVVRLRHLDGFTSWYFHLSPDSARVAVGDTVERGQPLALSGNTGRTTGAHLHFQVQADSADWGPSVAASFGPDCEVPTSGTAVTSQNANPRYP